MAFRKVVKLLKDEHHRGLSFTGFHSTGRVFTLYSCKVFVFVADNVDKLNNNVAQRND